MKVTRFVSCLAVLALAALAVAYSGGNAQAQEDCSQCDVDKSGAIDLTDALLVILNFDNPLYDVTGDGDTDLDDVLFITSHYGKSVTFAEPARDPLKQPFSSTSIWNMPIGSNAQYVDATLSCCDQYGVFLEEIYIFNTPNEPLVPLYRSSDLWTGRSRCEPDGGIVYYAPIPRDFIIEGAFNGNQANNPTAALTQDGKSYLQSQPITHCTADGPWTTGYQGVTVSIYGDGIPGSQGGSHLSSIGGTIRVGEWAQARDEGRFRHALKTVLSGGSFSPTTGGYRWPASTADSCWNSCYTGSNSAVKMGSLLALPASYDCNSRMTTEPGRIVCQTYKDYGSYIVDGGWDPAYLPVEIGPAGDVRQEFQQEFGISMKTSSTTSAWANDWERIIEDAVVVDNNGPSRIGGGGTPRLPLAPPIGQ